MLQPKTTETTGVYVWKKAIYQTTIWTLTLPMIFHLLLYLISLHPPQIMVFHWCPACISTRSWRISPGQSICTATKKQGEPVTARVVTTSHPLSPQKKIQKKQPKHPRLSTCWGLVFGSPKCTESKHQTPGGHWMSRGQPHGLTLEWCGPPVDPWPRWSRLAAPSGNGRAASGVFWNVHEETLDSETWLKNQIYEGYIWFLHVWF